ncbi:inactive polyglycylase TTLL10 [Silurus meridionalis]|nr:inactive polyglycylase TTLL10 [Silurus meridionalis]
MSAGSRVEIVQTGEALQGEDHVCVYSSKATEVQQGEAEDEEQGHLPAVLGKTVTLEPVGKDKQHKRTKVEKSLGRTQDTRGTKREQAIQADGTAAGEQLVYQIPNNRVLTTKIGLLNSLREYERVSCKINHGKGQRRLKMCEFIPDTFRMDVKDEREAFFSQTDGLYADKGHIWICKPTGLNQGRGIFLLHTPEDIAAFKGKMQMLADSHTNKKIPFCRSQAMIAQRYIQNPLLLKGKKFDVRSYFLIACTTPYMVFFRHGYVRLTCDLYDPKSNNLTAHLTNQYMQKKNPLYSMLKEETVWSMEHFNTYINEKFVLLKGLPRDWALSVFTRRMQQIIAHCFLAVKSKLECKLGYFDLIGCDFLIDDDFKVWLLEMNCNPALHTNCEVLKEVVPRTVTETLDLAMEIFNKCRCGLQLLPLCSQKDFVLLHCGGTASMSFTKQRSRIAGCSKRQSISKKTQQAVKISSCS